MRTTRIARCLSWVCLGLCGAALCGAEPNRPLAGLSVTVYWPPNQPEDRLILTDEVADDLREIGVETIRMVFWSPAGRIPFEVYDGILDRLEKRGIGVLGLLDNQIVAAPRDEWGTDAYRKRFVAAAEAVVGRYHERIRDWEVWNEEDYTDFAVDPGPYARLLTETWAVIHRIDPSAVVGLGGLSSAWDASGRYLRRVYEAPAARAFHEKEGRWPFDAVCVHPYHWKTSPDAYLADAIRKNILPVMAAHGDAEKPIWLTEIGWSLREDHPTGLGLPRNEAELVQALYLTRLFRVARESTRDPLSDMPLIQRVYWFQYRGAFGLEDLGGDPHISREAYRRVVAEWNREKTPATK